MENVETSSIILGLLVALTAGAILFVGELVIEWLVRRKRRKYDAKAQELFNLKTGLHSSDDIYGDGDWDSWPELEQYLEQRPGLREQYEREAMSHRGKGQQ